MNAPVAKRVELPLSPDSAGASPSPCGPAAASLPARPSDGPACAGAAWRQDFPVDWPQDHYVRRRDFTKFLMLTSLPFALVQVALAVTSWLRRHRGQSPIVAVARLADVPVGGVVAFNYPTAHDPCVLVRPDDRSLVAYSQKCTHLGCPVAPEVEQKRFFCPCHLASFDLASGRPLAGPPRRPLPRILLENRGGVLYAVGVEAATA